MQHYRTWLCIFDYDLWHGSLHHFHYDLSNKNALISLHFTLGWNQGTTSVVYCVAAFNCYTRYYLKTINPVQSKTTRIQTSFSKVSCFISDGCIYRITKTRECYTCLLYANHYQKVFAIMLYFSSVKSSCVRSGFTGIFLPFFSQNNTIYQSAYQTTLPHPYYILSL